MPTRPDAITRVCRSEYAAYHHSGDRRPASIRYVVLHSTEGATAEAAARWLEQPTSTGSANLVLDDDRCYRTLLDHVIPWAAPPLNTLGLHIEQAGYAKWTRRDWLKHRRTIERAAYKAALRCRWYHIPPTFLDVAALRLDYGAEFQGQHQPGPLAGGITTHAVVSEAFGESDHTDPGTGYPMDIFLNYLRDFLATPL